MSEIADQFSPSDNAADLGILYECTGHQAETESGDFWDNYADFEDFEELGGDKLVHPEKNEKENDQIRAISRKVAE